MSTEDITALATIAGLAAAWVAAMNLTGRSRR